jgi:hypothetical protein
LTLLPPVLVVVVEPPLLVPPELVVADPPVELRPGASELAVQPAMAISESEAERTSVASQVLKGL